MNSNSLNNTISYLDLNEILFLFQINKKILNIFLTKLIKENNFEKINYSEYKIIDYINW